MSDAQFRYQHLIRQDCPLPPGTHVIAYCRDSGGDEQDRSVSQQVEVAQEYCQRHRLILEQVYTEEARQSSNTEKREQLQQMLLDIRQRFKRINDRYKRDRLSHERPFGVIFWKSNRLGRDSIESTNIKTDLRLRGITIVELITSANTGNAAIDALIEAFQQWQDEMLLDEISNNAKRGLADLVTLTDTDPRFRELNPDWETTGNYLGIMPGTLPMGFKAERISISVRSRLHKKAGGEKHTAQRMVPNHDDQIWERCRLAWEMRMQGASIKTIMEATRLFSTVAGYDHFFTNRIYTGVLGYGGKRLENFVPALIPTEWFEEEQRRRQARSAKRKGERIDPALEPRRIASRHLLAGLVFCGAAHGEEHPMSGDTTRSTARNSRHDYYVCTVMKNSRKRRCQARRVNAVKLERAIVDQLMNNVLTKDTLYPIARVIAETLSERNDDLQSRIAAVQQQLSEAMKAADQIADAVEQVGYSPTLHQRLSQREEDIRQLRSDMARLNAQQITNTQIPSVSEAQLEEWLVDLRETLLSDDSETARQVVQSLVEKVVVTGDEVKLFYTFPFTDHFRNGTARPEGTPTFPNNTPIMFHLSTLGRGYAETTDYQAREHRKRAILELHAQGLTYAQIAQQLGIPESTAQYLATHR